MTKNKTKYKQTNKKKQTKLRLVDKEMRWCPVISGKPWTVSQGNGVRQGREKQEPGAELGGIQLLSPRVPSMHLTHGILEGGFYCLLRTFTFFNSDLHDKKRF